MGLDSPGALTICHVDAERKFSGGEVQVFLLMHGLRALGHRSILFAPEGSQAASRAAREGFEVRHVALSSDLDFVSVFRTTAALRELKPDLLHAHTARAAWLSGLAAARARVPAIVTRRMDRRVRSGWKTNLLYGRLTRAVAAISHSVAQALIDGGVERERIVVIHSSIDPGAYRPTRSRSDLRAELGAAADALVVLTLGALVHRKGLDVLFRALGKLATDGLRPVVWIAGEGPERGALEALAGRHSLANVKFLGLRSDVANLLCAADVFAMPSRREGLGVAALEACASGCAVVASRVGGLAEIVEAGVSGLLVPPEDPLALAAALEALIRDPAERARLASAGRTRVEALYRADDMVRAYEALYRSVLAQAKAHAREGG